MSEPINRGINGQFLPGTGGRPDGAINHLTRTVKETVLAVFNDLQADPKVNLTAWAKEQPTEFYRIAAKLIPTDIKADIRFTKVTLQIVRTNTTIPYLDPPSIPAEGNGSGQTL